MSVPSYRHALGESWHLTWRHPLIWPLGLMAALAGQFGLGDFLGQITLWLQTRRTSWLLNLDAFISAWTPRDLSDGLSLTWLLCIVFSLLIVLTFLAISAKGALIAWSAHSGEKHFTLIWKQGIQHFWRLLAIALIEKFCLLVTFLILILLGGELLKLNNNWASWGLTILITAVIILSLSISAIAMYASGYVIISKNKLWTACRQSGKIFLQHPLVTLELSVLLWLINWVLIAVLITGSYLVFAPAAAGLFAFGSTEIAALMYVGLAFSTFLFLLLTILGASFFQAFTTIAWTRLFVAMNRFGFKSRVWQWIKNIFHQ